MQTRVASALAIVTLLIVSSLLWSAPAARGAPAHPAALAPRPMATDSVSAATNFFCGAFEVGYSCGAVYYSAFDPSDSTAIVQINDPNATRDGLPGVTVVSWNVSFATSIFNDSSTWNIFYQIPLTVVYGGWWNITINGATAGFAFENFYVHSYTVGLQPTVPVVLSQHHSSVLYMVDKTVNGAPMSGITSLTMTALYLTNTATWATLPGTPAQLGTAPWGMFNFSVPSDANTYGSIQFTLFANASGAGANPNSERGFVSQSVGYVTTPSVSLGSCPSGCFSSSFSNGSLIYVTIDAAIIGPGADAPAVGMTATFEFLSGVTSVTPPGSYPHTITTNASGGGQILFVAQSPLFTLTGTNSVKVTLTDPLNSGASYGPSTANFDLTQTPPGSAGLQVVLDSAQYYGGDTAKATWEVGGLNQSLTAGWVVTGWWAWEADSNTFIASGMINSTATTGQFSFTVPMNYVGRLEVQVEASNATASLGANRLASVSSPTIFLNPSQLYYAPGDTLTVGVSTLGQVFQNATLYRTVTDNLGNVLQSGSFTGGTITIQIPNVGAPSDVIVSVSGQDPQLGVIGASTVTIYEAAGYQVAAGVATVSNYADGSFQPGQTIDLQYTITPIGVTALPKVFSIEVFAYSAYLSSGTSSRIFTTSSSSGTVPFTIPSNTPAGAQLFELFVVAQGCFTSCYAGGAFSVNVEPNPSVLGYELGAGSGVTVGWTILLILILVVALLLWRMGRHGGKRPMVMAPTPSSSSSSGSSSAPAGASGLSEGSSSEGSSPPLPPPK